MIDQRTLRPFTMILKNKLFLFFLGRSIWCWSDGGSKRSVFDHKEKYQYIRIKTDISSKSQNCFQRTWHPSSNCLKHCIAINVQRWRVSWCPSSRSSWSLHLTGASSRSLATIRTRLTAGASCPSLERNQTHACCRKRYLACRATRRSSSCTARMEWSGG